MDKVNVKCNFLYPTVMDISQPSESLAYSFRRRVRRPISAIIRNTLVPQFNKKKGEEPIPLAEIEPLYLQPGEWAQVRSIDEISATLDKNNKYKGLLFMPEMEKFCGKKYPVFKKVEIIKLESTGEVRKIQSPTVFLEGVYCNGERHEGCDRACFHFWREAWLKRVS